MEFDGINASEMEKQRYHAIKKTGKYLELNILIGAEDEHFDQDSVGKMPVIYSHMCNCGAAEIGCLYMSLQTMMKSLEKQYPVECVVAKVAMRVEDMGAIPFSSDDDKEES